MAARKSWWQMRRIKHRDAVTLCVLSASCLLAGELTTPILGQIYVQYLAPYLGSPAVFAVRALLAVFAFTTAFGAVLVLSGGWYFLQGRIGSGRMLVGLGVGLTSVSFASKLAYAVLVYDTPLRFLLPLATTLAGMGILFGFAAHVVMGQYALLLKKRARIVFRRWRRTHRYGILRA